MSFSNFWTLNNADDYDPKPLVKAIKDYHLKKDETEQSMRELILFMKKHVEENKYNPNFVYETAHKDLELWIELYVNKYKKDFSS